MTDAVDDCLFCKIITGEVPSDAVRETEHVLAFRDVNPQAPTHVLVVPKRHHESAAASAAADPNGFAELFAVAAQVAADEELPGYRAVFNTGSAVGQTVFHTHLHVLGGRDLAWPPG